MNNKTFEKSVFLGKTILTILMLLFSATFLNAQTVTFGQYTQRVASQDFVFTNNTLNATFRTVDGGSPVSFTYSNISFGLPAELSGPQDAHVFISSTTTAPAQTSLGNRAVQPFNSTFTVQILRDTPFMGLSNLLTATVTTATSNPDLTGEQNSMAAAFTASTPIQNIVFTSSFINFSGTSNRDFSLSFSSVNPSYTIGATFLNDFTAAGTGTFASSPPPIFMLTPTAATVSVGGRIMTPNGKGIGGVKVTITGTNGGESKTVVSEKNGYYSFPDIESGEAYIITVTAKQYTFAQSTQLQTVLDDRNDINFIASPVRRFN